MEGNVLKGPDLTIYAGDFPEPKFLQPFPMQGSKRKQSGLIALLSFGDYSSIYEPFCGSATASMAMRISYPDREVFLNDKNSDIALLWKAILDSPGQLASDYEEIWLAQFDEDGVADPRSYFNSIRSRFNESSSRSPAEFLFILNRIVKGALRYNSNGYINQSADGRRFGARPKTVRERIFSSQNILKGSSVTSLDWRDSLIGANKDSFIYLDPPYQGTTDTSDKRYISGLSYVDFRAGVENLIDRDLPVLISYDAIAGPATYGRALNGELDLLALDVITGVSSQSTLLGQQREAHETLYLTPRLVQNLGGVGGVQRMVASPNSVEATLFSGSIL